MYFNIHKWFPSSSLKMNSILAAQEKISSNSICLSPRSPVPKTTVSICTYVQLLPFSLLDPWGHFGSPLLPSYQHSLMQLFIWFIITSSTINLGTHSLSCLSHPKTFVAPPLCSDYILHCHHTYLIYSNFLCIYQFPSRLCSSRAGTKTDTSLHP